MTKSEYMKILSHRLRRLPKEDYYRAIEYFEEYFAEAGLLFTYGSILLFKWFIKKTASSLGKMIKRRTQK